MTNAGTGGQVPSQVPGQAPGTDRLQGASLNWVFGVQFALVVLVAGVYLLWRGQPDRPVVLGALYGAAVSLSTTLMLWWRERRAARRSNPSSRALFDFYLSAFERLGWIVVMLGLALAMEWFQALPLLAGFLTGQAAAMVASVASLAIDFRKVTSSS